MKPKSTTTTGLAPAERARGLALLAAVRDSGDPTGTAATALWTWMEMEAHILPGLIDLARFRASYGQLRSTLADAERWIIEGAQR